MVFERSICYGIGGKRVSSLIVLAQPYPSVYFYVDDDKAVVEITIYYVCVCVCVLSDF